MTVRAYLGIGLSEEKCKSQDFLSLILQAVMLGCAEHHVIACCTECLLFKTRRNDPADQHEREKALNIDVIAKSP